MITLDTETCGLHGMPVLLQYAIDDANVEMYDLWKNPVGETLELIEWICTQTVCGFNLVYDWFHLSKIYTTWSLAPSTSWIPEDHINSLAILEEKARFTDICIKPKSACDIMLLARKTHFQSLMDRDDISIRRIPTALAYKLAAHLESTIKFENIYFARKKDKNAPRWAVYDIKDSEGNVNPNFKDIKLKFAASGGLKNLAIHALKLPPESVLKFTDIEVNKKFWPDERGYAPFALSISRGPDWFTFERYKKQGRTWPGVIQYHINHWAYNELARKYASDDVTRYTYPLYQYFGSPEPGDDDSELSCCVASVRWSGFAIDVPKLQKVKTDATAKVKKTPIAPKVAKKYLYQVMDEMERMAMKGSTKKVVLQEIAKWAKDDPENQAAKRAQEILDARQAKKEIEIYDKLLLAGRFHASFKIIGALSSRMSGADKLNAQGIKHQLYVRECFPLGDSDGRFEILVEGYRVNGSIIGLRLCGGDFDSFEVAIACVVFDDPKLIATLKSGKKIHALLGAKIFKKSYEEILSTKGMEPDLYDTGKKSVFLIFYGGDANSMKNRLGIPLEDALEGCESMMTEYQGIGRFQEKIQEKLGCLRQPAGIGTKVEWHEPVDYIESFLGFRRFFTLENRVCRALFDLAQNIPSTWRAIKIKVQRREKIQSASGAVSSALYGAAFGIASRNIRAGKNHEIQSPGAIVTKSVQRKIWDYQPVGINPWMVKPMNVHDELLAPTRPGHEENIKKIVDDRVQYYREKIPLIAMKWQTGMKSWAEK
jgi:hypothetical protein